MNTRTFNLPPILMKVGKRSHLEKLKEEGEVHFGTYEGYRQQENEEFLRIKEKILNEQPITPDDFDTIRRDHLEGLEKTLSGKTNIKLMHEGTKIEIKGIEASLNLFQDDYTHLYCMFGFARQLPRNFCFDKRLRHFGDHVLFFDSKRFLEGIAHALPKKFDFNYVKYYNDENDQQLGPFAKRDLFSYQYEYRIATNLPTNKICIGNILNVNSTHLIKFDDLSNIKLEFA